MVFKDLCILLLSTNLKYTHENTVESRRAASSLHVPENGHARVVLQPGRDQLENTTVKISTENTMVKPKVENVPENPAL